MKVVSGLKGLGAVAAICSVFGCATGQQAPSQQSPSIEPVVTRAPQSLTVEAGSFTVKFRCAGGDKVQAELLRDNQRVESKVYGLNDFAEKLKNDTRNLRYLGYWDKAENRDILEVGNKAATLCNG